MDINYLLFLQNIRNNLGGILNNFFAFVTTISVDYYIIMIPLIIYWAVDKKKGLFIYISHGLGCILNAITKSTFCVYRPWIKDPRVMPLESVKSGASGYSFPSGHATSVSSTYLPLANKYKKNFNGRVGIKIIETKRYFKDIFLFGEIVYNNINKSPNKRR